MYKVVEECDEIRVRCNVAVETRESAMRRISKEGGFSVISVAHITEDMH
jgi:hypothetical protein